MTVSFFAREPAGALHVPLARCYTYLYASMYSNTEIDIEYTLNYFLAQDLGDMRLPRWHALFTVFGTPSWEQMLCPERLATVPGANLPFASVRELLRFLRVHTDILDSKAQPIETLQSNMISRDRAWFVTFSDIEGLSLHALMQEIGPFLPLFATVTIGKAFQSVEHYHLLLVSPWPILKDGLKALFMSLHPQSFSAVRSISKTRGYLLRQSFDVEEYKAPYVLPIQDDMLLEMNNPLGGYFNLPRYSVPPERCGLALSLHNKAAPPVVVRDVVGSAEKMALALLGPQGIYRGGRYMDQGVSVVDCNELQVVVRIKKD